MARIKQEARKRILAKAPVKGFTTKSKVPRASSKSNEGGVLVVAKSTQQDKPRKPHRYRPGTVALRMIRRYQKNTDKLTARAPFRRFTKQLAGEVDERTTKHDIRFSANAVLALQELTENHMVDVLRRAYMITLAKSKVTLHEKDIATYLRLIKE